MALIVVPARLRSSRLPQKLIQKISGKEIILYLLYQLQSLQQDHEVVVTTDTPFIQQLIEGYGNFHVKYSNRHYNNGTERIADVASDYPHQDIVVNVQADEYDISAADVESLLRSFEQFKDMKIGTLVGPLEEHQITDHSVVKALLDEKQVAIDFIRDILSNNVMYYGHHGVYAYKNAILQEIARLPETNLEKARSLEQMRWLESGYQVHCVHTNRTVSSLNTIADLRLIRKSFESE